MLWVRLKEAKDENEKFDNTCPKYREDDKLKSKLEGLPKVKRTRPTNSRRPRHTREKSQNLLEASRKRVKLKFLSDVADEELKPTDLSLDPISTQLLFSHKLC